MKKVKGELIALAQIGLLVLLLRIFIFEPFYIPSGSMESGLKHGDFVFAWKGSYGYSQFSVPFAPIKFDGRIGIAARPKRGDVVVFRNPANPKLNYIKRMMGLPNDSLQLRQGRLFINEILIERQEIAPYTPRNSVREYPHYQEILDNGKVYNIIERSGDIAAVDNTKTYKVPEAHYFGLGDNRDASQDSRYLKEVGYIPEENLVGRAAFILFSIDPHYPWWQLWRNIRFNRIGTLL